MNYPEVIIRIFSNSSVIGFLNVEMNQKEFWYLLYDDFKTKHCHQKEKVETYSYWYDNKKTKSDNPMAISVDREQIRQGSPRAYNRYFIERDSSNPDKRDTKSLTSYYKSFILSYIDYPKEQWLEQMQIWKKWDNENELLLFENFTITEKVVLANSFACRNYLNGIWRVYLRFGNDIYKTYASVAEDNSITYLSIHRKGEMRGELVTQGKDRFRLQVHTHDFEREFMIHSRLDKDMLKGVALLPSYGVTYEGNRIRTTPIMLWKCEEEQSRKIEDLKAWHVRTFKEEYSLEREIAIYLSQKENSMTDYFRDDPIQIINSRFLEKLGRANYNNLKKRLAGKKWISISRILKGQDKLATYSWDFEFEDAFQICKVTRKSDYQKGGTEYTGEVKIYKDHLWIELHGNGNHKFFYSQKEDIEDDLEAIALGLSTSVYGRTNSNYVVKELLISQSRFNSQKNVANNAETKLLDYETFRDVVQVPPEYKIHLAIRNQAVLNYEDANNNKTSAYRQLEAATYFRGKYFIYIRNIYDQKQLFRSILEIDSLGVCSMVKEYDDGKPNVLYQGNAEYIAQTLRIVLEHKPQFHPKGDGSRINKRQFCEIKLICNNVKKDVYLGIQSDTDVYQSVHANSCILVKYEAMKRDIDLTYESAVISNEVEAQKANVVTEVEVLWDNLEYGYGKTLADAFTKPGEKPKEISGLNEFFQLTEGEFGIRFHGYFDKVNRKY